MLLRARVIAVSTASAANVAGSASGRADLLRRAHVFIEDGAWGPTHAISNKEVVRARLAASAVARSPSPRDAAKQQQQQRGSLSPGLPPRARTFDGHGHAILVVRQEDPRVPARAAGSALPITRPRPAREHVAVGSSCRRSPSSPPRVCQRAQERERLALADLRMSTSRNPISWPRIEVRSTFAPRAQAGRGGGDRGHRTSGPANITCTGSSHRVLGVSTCAASPPRST